MTNLDPDQPRNSEHGVGWVRRNGVGSGFQ
jgi:hypothetical protein